MKIMARYAVLPFFLTITGCATQGSMDIVRSDIDTIKTRLFSAEKDLGGVREYSREGLESVEKGFKSDVAEVRKISAEIQASIDSTKSEMQALNGRVDDIAIAVKKPTDELGRYREDADKRIIALEDRIIKLQTTVDELNKKFVELTQQVQQKKEEPVTPDSLYMKGLDTFKAGEMSAARDIFTKFIEQYPQHELSANAHYWVGETYYSEKNYERAILAFEEVVKNFPLKEKVPAAMLKQAMSFKAINDNKTSKIVLKKLVEGFPKSEEARKAKELLKEIK